MNKHFFKLVPATPLEILSTTPHIVLVTSSSVGENTKGINEGHPDWVLNLIQGSVGVFNMKHLVKENLTKA
jgi:hypothetical protein